MEAGTRPPTFNDVFSLVCTLSYASNLVLLCSKHHHVVHQKPWHIKLRPDGAVEVTLPDGTTRTSDPPQLL